MSSVLPGKSRGKTNFTIIESPCLKGDVFYEKQLDFIVLLISVAEISNSIITERDFFLKILLGKRNS